MSKESPGAKSNFEFGPCKDCPLTRPNWREIGDAYGCDGEYPCTLWHEYMKEER